MFRSEENLRKYENKVNVWTRRLKIEKRPLNSALRWSLMTSRLFPYIGVEPSLQTG